MTSKETRLFIIGALIGLGVALFLLWEHSRIDMSSKSEIKRLQDSLVVLRDKKLELGLQIIDLKYDKSKLKLEIEKISALPPKIKYVYRQKKEGIKALTRSRQIDSAFTARYPSDTLKGDTLICSPATRIKAAMVDLVEGDEAKALVPVYEAKIDLQEKEILKSDTIINKLEKKDSLSTVQLQISDREHKLESDDQKAKIQNLQKGKFWTIVISVGAIILALAL